MKRKKECEELLRYIESLPPKHYYLSSSFVFFDHSKEEVVRRLKERL